VRRWIARLRRLDRRRIDQVTAAVLVVAGEIELLVQWDGERRLLLNAMVLGIAYGVIAFRRTQPLLAAAVMLGCWTFMNLFLVEVEPLQLPLVAVLIAAYGTGAYTSGRAALAAPFVLVAGMLAVVTSFDEQVFTDFVFPTGFALVAWLAGRGLSTRARLTEELH
jgi:hypothetical protein